MAKPQGKTPVVMAFSANDPTGGGGLQADIETLFSLGCHCASVVTMVTAQDTRELKDFGVIPASLVIEQARVVLEDMPIAAFKVGMLGSVENASAIHTLLRDYPQIPVVFHPCINNRLRERKATADFMAAITSLLFPLTTLLILDSDSAQQLTPGADTLDACAHKLLEYGSNYILITGVHETTPTVKNLLYSKHELIKTFSWERLPEQYHGCGCTLSASVAGFIAQGSELIEATYQGQFYTWECLQQGTRLGMGSQLPNRLTWLLKK
jgi:hydroxymethylpyrimidine/phosphomethylpyrimidine kinase